MVLKMRSLAFALLLIMLFSGVACGYNLLLGGINQSEPCVEPCSSAANDEYKKIAASLDAYYFPMYYLPTDEDNSEEVRKAAMGVASEQNGLENGALKNRPYETIVAYSGGTSTAITAIANQGVTCDTLILVSPMSAGVERETVDTALNNIKNCENDKIQGRNDICAWYENEKLKFQAKTNFMKQLASILAAKPPVVNHIIVIQSEQDQLEHGDIYQFRDFDGIDDDRITVQPVTLDSTGEDAHKDLFFKYATSHLANDGDGITFSPTGQSTKPNPFEANPEARLLGEIGVQQQSKDVTLNAPPVFIHDKMVIGSKYENGFEWEEGSESWKRYQERKAEQTIENWTLNHPELTDTQHAPVTSSQGSENSVVGTWNFIWNTPMGPSPLTVTFNSDGTFNQPGWRRQTQNGWKSQQACTGRWVQNGDHVSWNCAYTTGTDTWEGTIQMNSMNGMAHGRSWSAERAGS